jgi:hypothetical protein
MEMQLYALHVIPFIVFFYLAFLLFMRPPRGIVLASLLGGLAIGIIKALVDLIAYYTSLWYYTVTGLILHLPLPYYATQIFIYGGIAYLLIWRFGSRRGSWFARLLLIGVPLLGFISDLLSATEPQPALVWHGVLAGIVDFLTWLLMFYVGLWVFKQFVPKREHGLNVA